MDPQIYRIVVKCLFEPFSGRWKMTTVCSWLYPVVETKKMSLVKPKLWKVASLLTCKPNRQLASLMYPTPALTRFVLNCSFSSRCCSWWFPSHTVFMSTTGSLCGANIPAVWILGKPSFTPGSGPSQQHLQHFPSPHDCYSLCLIDYLHFLFYLFFSEQCQHQPFWIEPVWKLDIFHPYEFDSKKKKKIQTTKRRTEKNTIVSSFTSPSP